MALDFPFLLFLWSIKNMEITFWCILVLLDLFDFYLSFFFFHLWSVQLGFFSQHRIFSLGLCPRCGFLAGGCWEFISSFFKSYYKLLESPVAGLGLPLPLSVLFSQVAEFCSEYLQINLEFVRSSHTPLFLPASSVRDADTTLSSGCRCWWEYLSPGCVLDAVCGCGACVRVALSCS